MAFKYKFKPSQADIIKWELEKENFKNEIDFLNEKYKQGIKINKSYNSVYFSTFKVIGAKMMLQEYRISTHHSKLAEISGVNGDGYKLPEVNIVTNSRKNIIKKIKEILESVN